VPPYLHEKLVCCADKKLMTIGARSKLRTYRFRSDREYVCHLSKEEKDLLKITPARPKAKKASLEIYNCNRKASLSSATLIWKTGTARKPTDKDAKNVLAAGEAT